MDIWKLLNVAAAIGVLWLVMDKMKEKKASTPSTATPAKTPTTTEAQVAAMLAAE